MRPFLLLILLFSVFVVRAQKTVPLKKKNVGASVQAYAGGDLDTCLNRQFSLVIYGIQDSLNQRTLQTYGSFTDSLVANLNRAFARMCVSFKACSTVIIPHYSFNYWRFPKTDQAAVQGWYTPGVINVYVPDELRSFPSNDENGYAYSMGVSGAVQNTLNVVVTSFGAIATNGVGKRFTATIHAFGHFFGLPDTFAPLGPAATPPPPSFAIISHEFADGSNSLTNGDLFSDTEADCYPHEHHTPPYVKHVNCQYGLEAKDGKGRVYTPPLDNYMSQWACRCQFTQQQRNAMVKFILQNRMNLH